MTRGPATGLAQIQAPPPVGLKGRVVRAVALRLIDAAELRKILGPALTVTGA